MVASRLAKESERATARRERVRLRPRALRKPRAGQAHSLILGSGFVRLHRSCRGSDPVGRRRCRERAAFQTLTRVTRRDCLRASQRVRGAGHLLRPPRPERLTGPCASVPTRSLARPLARSPACVVAASCESCASGPLRANAPRLELSRSRLRAWRLPLPRLRLARARWRVHGAPSQTRPEKTTDAAPHDKRGLPPARSVQLSAKRGIARRNCARGRASSAVSAVVG